MIMENGKDDAPATPIQENVGSRSAQHPSSFAGYGNNSADGKIIEAPPLCDAMLEDHAFIKEDLPKAAILTLTGQFVTVVIMRTPYSRVQLRVQVCEYLSYLSDLLILYCYVSFHSLTSPDIFCSDSCIDISCTALSFQQDYNFCCEFFHFL